MYLYISLKSFSTPQSSYSLMSFLSINTFGANPVGFSNISTAVTATVLALLLALGYSITFSI